MNSIIKPTPLFGELEPAQEIPFTALGSLADVVHAIQIKTQAPAAIAMQSVLAAVSLTVQPHANVDTLGGPAPCSLFLFTVAASGERKSSCDRFATHGLVEFGSKRLRSYKFELEEFEGSQNGRSKRRKLASKKSNYEVLDDDYTHSAHGDNLAEPIDPSMLMADITIEGLQAHLRNGNPSVGV
ncbi:MAG: DUF3987 domain-containing protein, partial [Alphaproteobacteria bacterium]|nr:DUF3987 domain-containing protein [Alphaproteobacteria bacterium]